MKPPKTLTTIIAATCTSITAWAEITPQPAFSDELQPETIVKVASAVADWQLANPYERADWDWTEGALWTGLLAHAQTTGAQKYREALLKVSADLNYQLGPRPHFGDDHCVGQLHLWHYLRDELTHQLEPTRRGMLRFADRPHDESLLWVNHIHMREWAWCDALYMSPPTLTMLYAATGNELYLEKLDELWWKTSDYLYDKESQLYFRDSKYFEPREKNGEKVFWSRGNGWVFAGLCHVLQYLPHDHPTRPKYIEQFKQMAAKLKAIQQADGSWRASLLDPASYPSPESSGTAFFTYGFIWGVNNGFLDEKTYLPAVVKGWKRLVQNVHPDGKLGFVQPIGQDPRTVSYEQTAVYGVGGFLQVAHELHKHLILKQSSTAKLQAQNPDKDVRLNEVVSVPWKKITTLVPKANAENIAVRDSVSSYFLPCQVVDNNQDGSPDALLFISDFTPNEKRTFQILACGKLKPRLEQNPMLARFVPERKDDFVWENDRIAYRAYGPALAAENARGGIDVWTKSVRRPVANEWYAKGDAHYHTDNGTGLDGYKVGSSLGCGGVGYLDSKGKLHTSPVFAKQTTIEQGPVRLKFKLTYPAIQIGETEITETRTITMLRGQHHFEVNSSFQIKGDAKGIRPVTGLARRSPKQKASAYSGHFFGYWDPIMEKENHGHIGTFIIHSTGKSPSYKNKNHILQILAKDLNKPVSFHAGAIWGKAEGLDPAGFERHLFHQAHAITHPILVQ
ncbi:glycoside hydrolase family 88 protein [Verrucomicrobiaceae bacterium N1E253]|uniref:Glycoside hydrolase family 88 protein n=1 Tax=Oceaniferula marina TaxID=2748318 RepID=A0A851GN90_9BACT|nr:glycoside hydrolase family 88 protein [Oceaniferula marina]NWK55594.1 glycoside hydrolase family 88 protein [Oceaniferula marina]